MSGVRTLTVGTGSLPEAFLEDAVEVGEIVKAYLCRDI